jgi:hypothetical protein
MSFCLITALLHLKNPHFSIIPFTKCFGKQARVSGPGARPRGNSRNNACGTQLTNLSGLVGAQLGYSVFADLRKMDIPVEEGSAHTV